MVKELKTDLLGSWSSKAKKFLRSFHAILLKGGGGGEGWIEVGISSVCLIGKHYDPIPSLGRHSFWQENLVCEGFGNMAPVNKKAPKRANKLPKIKEEKYLGMFL